MLDPRIDLANMLFEMREKLNEIEMKLWEIPHHEEPVEEYEACIQQHQLTKDQKVFQMRPIGIHVANVGWNQQHTNGILTTIAITQTVMFHITWKPTLG